MAAKKKETNNEPLFVNGKYVIPAKHPLHPVTHEKGATPYNVTGKKVKVTLVKSTIACLEAQKATVEALGLTKIRQSKIFDDNDALRGMLYRVRHLVEVEEI